MTLDELKSLRQDEVVVFTHVDEKICEYHNWRVGDEATFLEFHTENIDVVIFIRNSYTISHFSYEICHYIERKVTLERDRKINNLFDEKKI